VPESPFASSRVKVTTTHERWFDVDAVELRAWFGDDADSLTADDLANDVRQASWDGDGLPSWLKERITDGDYAIDAEVLDLCPTHGRLMDTTQYDSKEPGCGSCWLEGYDADKSRGNRA
jgi:hypothetical protein